MPAQQQPIDLGVAPAESVVDFGPEPPTRRSRWPSIGSVRELVSDRRVVPLLGGLAAVAALASLFSEWQVTTIDAEMLGGDSGPRTVSAEIGDLGALGTGYLIGLFLVIPAVVLTLFGPPAGRRYARLAGLSFAGTSLGLLIALAASLGDRSGAIDRVYEIALDTDQISFTYGRGIWCALVAMALTLAALYLAGRYLGAPAAPGEAATGETAEPADPWSWRRPPARDRDEEKQPDEPLDLTVAPAKPFTTYSDDAR
ncbi:hypothetical protein AB0J83_12925 [Actinoplanes sp. NPDC049596]|uniref:hypothetical protein n=1 Tax=unclassified Actinoplanes TaxID=2626549 RepID=UPI003418734B